MPVLNVRSEARGEDGRTRPAPEVLAAAGPLIPVTLTLSDESQRALTEQHKPLPEPMTGYAMIDTGASQTCFDEDAARRAGLPITGAARMASASHADIKVPVFAGKILISGNLIIDAGKAMGANLSAFDGLIALIGRDLLQSAVFTYNGPDGFISLAM